VFFVCLFVFCLVFELRDFHFMGRYYTTAGFFCEIRSCFSPGLPGP
jgi:hypothetical protein